VRREFRKGVSGVEARWQCILSWWQGCGAGSDRVFLAELRRGREALRLRDARKGRWVLLADSGLDGQGVGARDLIPTIRRGGNLVAMMRVARAEWVAAARLGGLFVQRWKAETGHAVIKCTLGDAVRSRRVMLQKRELAIRGLVYNLHRQSSLRFSKWVSQSLRHNWRRIYSRVISTKAPLSEISPTTYGTFTSRILTWRA